MKLLEQFLMFCGMIGEIFAKLIMTVWNAIVGFIIH